MRVLKKPLEIPKKDTKEELNRFHGQIMKEKWDLHRKIKQSLKMIEMEDQLSQKQQQSMENEAAHANNVRPDELESLDIRKIVWIRREGEALKFLRLLRKKFENNKKHRAAKYFSSFNILSRFFKQLKTAADDERPTQLQKLLNIRQQSSFFRTLKNSLDVQKKRQQLSQMVANNRKSLALKSLCVHPMTVSRKVLRQFLKVSSKKVAFLRLRKRMDYNLKISGREQQNCRKILNLLLIRKFKIFFNDDQVKTRKVSINKKILEKNLQHQLKLKFINKIRLPLPSIVQQVSKIRDRQEQLQQNLKSHKKLQFLSCLRRPLPTKTLRRFIRQKHIDNFLNKCRLNANISMLTCHLALKRIHAFFKNLYVHRQSNLQNKFSFNVLFNRQIHNVLAKCWRVLKQARQLRKVEQQMNTMLSNQRNLKIKRNLFKTWKLRSRIRADISQSSNNSQSQDSKGEQVQPSFINMISKNSEVSDGRRQPDIPDRKQSGQPKKSEQSMEGSIEPEPNQSELANSNHSQYHIKMGDITSALVRLQAVFRNIQNYTLIRLKNFIQKSESVSKLVDVLSRLIQPSRISAIECIKQAIKSDEQSDDQEQYYEKPRIVIRHLRSELFLRKIHQNWQNTSNIYKVSQQHRKAIQYLFFNKLKQNAIRKASLEYFNYSAEKLIKLMALNRLKQNHQHTIQRTEANNKLIKTIKSFTLSRFIKNSRFNKAFKMLDKFIKNKCCLNFFRQMSTNRIKNTDTDKIIRLSNILNERLKIKFINQLRSHLCEAKADKFIKQANLNTLRHIFRKFKDTVKNKQNKGQQFQTSICNLFTKRSFRLIKQEQGAAIQLSAKQQKLLQNLRHRNFTKFILRVKEMQDLKKRQYDGVVSIKANRAKNLVRHLKQTIQFLKIQRKTSRQRKERNENMSRYGRHKHQQFVKRQCFSALKAIFQESQRNHNLSLMARSLQCLKTNRLQQIMLKDYLQEYESTVNYYPKSMEERQQFERLKRQATM